MTRPRKLLRRVFGFLGLACLFVLCAAGGTMAYFHFAPPAQTCLTCHEMQAQHDRWTASAHRDIHCRACHGGSLTLEWHALKEHADRVRGHFAKATHDDVRLTHEQVLRVSDACAGCHRAEAAKWQAGAHSATYARIFLDAKQNQAEQLNADCLRCHGMFFGGTTADLVTPLDTKGPWGLKHAEMAAQPTIPCLACHRVHVPAPTAGAAVASATRADGERGAAAAQAQFYVRRERTHFPLEDLPVPAVRQGDKTLRGASDPRGRLCVQCHAPDAQHARGSRDDRTPAGVHEGLSCAACHDPHSNSARDSCARCHPGVSNCGLDVHTMDTTFKAAASKHDVHAVACGDCHQGKRPAPRAAPK